MTNDRLRDALMAARVTQEDLAADLGVSTKTVERWITQAPDAVPAVPAPDLGAGAEGRAVAMAGRLLAKRRGEITESEIVADLSVPGRRAR